MPHQHPPKTHQGTWLWRVPGTGCHQAPGTLLAMASPSSDLVAQVEEVPLAKPPAAAPGAANSTEIGQTFRKKPRRPDLAWS